MLLGKCCILTYNVVFVKLLLCTRFDRVRHTQFVADFPMLILPLLLHKVCKFTVNSWLRDWAANIISRYGTGFSAILYPLRSSAALRRFQGVFSPLPARRGRGVFR